jgi:hypothetical protein
MAAMTGGGCHFIASCSCNLLKINDNSSIARQERYSGLKAGIFAAIAGFALYRRQSEGRERQISVVRIQEDRVERAA